MQSEKVPVRIYASSKEASRAVAHRIAAIVREKAAAGKCAVLGLATGHTPVNVYKELIRLHQREGLSLANVVTFNLDEYWPIQPRDIQSYHYWMHENLFRHVDIPTQNIHIPQGDLPEGQVEEYCRQYEEQIALAGGIDLQLLGIGRTGHIGFNEPGSPPESRTRKVWLDKVTRKDAASDFFGEENVPAAAITMGVGSILQSREIALLAFGENKAPIVKRAVEGEISSAVAASFLQQHPKATFYIDDSAAAELTRIDEPWLLGPCVWDEVLERHAVIWLARKLGKAILKLTDEDYAENRLADLCNRSGAYDLNIKIFRQLMETITGWPGGKNGRKRVLVLSPHPDDDVICMGGTVARLAEQGHQVHAAYMVSGYLSVFDHDVSRFADFVRGFNNIFGLTVEQTVAIEQHIDRFLHQKRPGDIDTPEIQKIKGLIRRTEAIDAAKFCGVTEEHIHFLDLPFYNTGRVAKLSIGREDVDLVGRLLDEVKPEMIFAAGDMSDPHGTHRLCMEALLKALDQHKTATGQSPELWLYRGAWQEWPPEAIDMAVPLSPDELRQKRFAIFRHQSQKDRAMFPGPYDSREFWQRAEERNIGTATIYDQLGLPEYHAIEAFALYPPARSTHLASQLTKAE